MIRFLRAAALPVGLLMVGVLLSMLVLRASGQAERSPPERKPVPVEVVLAELRPHDAVIQATGVVTAAHQVDLVPEVAGRVIEIAPGLIAGRRFAKGDLIARIDPADYRVRLTQAEAQVAAAQLELELERSRGRQAEREWELMGEQARNPLALRQAHLAAAEANLASAQAGVDQARRDLARTRISAPFDAVLTSQSVEVGQQVGGAAIARLVGTSALHVTVAAPVHQLAWLPAPSADPAATATVTQRLSDGRKLRATARLLERASELDADTRTARLTLSLDHPFADTDAGLPLLPGAYVDVTLTGRATEGVTLPRTALVGGNKVWIATRDDTLAALEVEVGWGTRDSVVIVSGLDGGERVVTTTLSLAVPGMPLSVLTPTARRGD